MHLIHPGKRLYQHFMQPLGLSQNRLAREIDVPPRRINEIILGKRGISADTAVRLAHYFGNAPEDWLKLQADFEITLARINLGDQLEKIKPLGQEIQASVNTTVETTSPSGLQQHAPKHNTRRRIMR